MFAREHWRRPGSNRCTIILSHTYMHHAYKRKLNTHQCTRIDARTHQPHSLWLSLACCVDGVKWIHPDRLWVFVWICIWFVGIKCVACLQEKQVEVFDRFLFTSQKPQHLNKTMLLLSYMWIILRYLRLGVKNVGAALSIDLSSLIFYPFLNSFFWLLLLEFRA